MTIGSLFSGIGVGALGNSVVPQAAEVVGRVIVGLHPGSVA